MDKLQFKSIIMGTLPDRRLRPWPHQAHTSVVRHLFMTVKVKVKAREYDMKQKGLLLSMTCDN